MHIFDEKIDDYLSDIFHGLTKTLLFSFLTFFENKYLVFNAQERYHYFDFYENLKNPLCILTNDDIMNDDKINAATSGNVGITTTSGEVIKIEMINDMVHFEKSFKCLKCGKSIDVLTKNYKCPHCKRDYEEALI